MANKLKYAATICPATINAMEDKYEEIKKDFQEEFSEKNAKEGLDIIERIKYTFLSKEKITIKDPNTNENIDKIKIGDSLNNEEINIIKDNKEYFLNEFFDICKYDLSTKLKITSAFQINEFLNFYIDDVCLFNIILSIKRINNKNIYREALLKNVISFNEEGIENLYQKENLKNMSFFQQMTHILLYLRKYNLAVPDKNKGNLIDSKYLIKTNGTSISIYNNNEENGIGINIRKFSENCDNYIIEIGNKKNINKII